MAAEQLQPVESVQGPTPDGEPDHAGASLAPVALLPERNDGGGSAGAPWYPEAETSPRTYQAMLLAGAAVAATAFWLRPTPPRLLHADLRELAIEAAAAAAPQPATVRDATTLVRHVRMTMTPLPSRSDLLGERPAALLTASWPAAPTTPAIPGSASTESR